MDLVYKGENDMIHNIRRKFIGDKEFHKKVLALMIPIMVQNGITNFVNMLDNVMIGRVGTVQMTGVAIANQLIFIFNLSIFGAISGPSIFGAQFFGKKDQKGLQYTFRFKVILCVLMTVIGITVFYFWGNPLTKLYLSGEGNVEDAVASLKFAREYMLIMFLGLLPYAMSQCYSSTLRETGQATVPMFSGMAAVVVNLCLNYILIYGKFGFPRLGTKGAAIATVISRFVELLVVALWTHLHSERNKFIVGVYKSIYIPRYLILRILAKGFPMLFNETMYAIGVALTNQCYSTRGYDVVSANNICNTFFSVFGVAFMAVGAAIAILLGQLLGAGKLDEAKESGIKLITFSVFVSAVVGTVFLGCASIIPSFYKTNDSVRYLATRLMQICALTMPLDAMAHACYFTLRAGGKIYITTMFDSGYIWFLSLPTAFILSSFTNISVLYIYAICQLLNLAKCIAGGILVEKGIWLKKIVE